MPKRFGTPFFGQSLKRGCKKSSKTYLVKKAFEFRKLIDKPGISKNLYFVIQLKLLKFLFLIFNSPICHMFAYHK